MEYSLNNLKKLLNQLDIRAVVVYLSVGVCSTIIYFSIFSLLWKLMHINYQIAVSIGYACLVMFHFYANRRFSFKAHSVKMSDQLTKYFIMIGINYLITMVIVHWATKTLLLSPYVGIALSISVTVSGGYLMSRFWVFRHSAPETNLSLKEF